MSPYPSLFSIIQDIEFSIRDTPQPVFIYIGVGAAAGLLTVNPDGTKFLDFENYHQFPSFLQSILIYKPQLHIILIDPTQENPPYMIKDHAKLNLPDFIQIDSHKYMSVNESTYVYIFNESVTMKCYPSDTYSKDITNDLTYLNNLCMKNNYSLLYHDFSGRDIRQLSEYFDDEIKDHLNHIVYGLGCRYYFGCYFDLRSPEANFITQLEYHPERNMISVINIYYYLKQRDYATIKFLKKLDDEIINKHIQMIIDNIVYKFRNEYMLVLRVVMRINNKQLEMSALDNISDCIPSTLLDVIKSNPEQSLKQVINYCTQHLDVVVRLKDFDISAEEIMQFILQERDMYKWLDMLKTFDI